MHGRDCHTVRSYLFHQQADRHDVCHGVHGAYLVEMDLADLASVDLALRLRKKGVDRLGVLLYLFGDVQSVYQGTDVCY